MRCATCLPILLWAASACGQATIHVDPTGCGPAPNGSIEQPFCTILDGVHAAQDGDTVLLADGVYEGDGNRDISFQGKAITVESANGPANCIIRCGGDTGFYRAFAFENGETESSVLRGLTMIEGRSSDGGAVFCHWASPMIQGCVIRDCEGNAGGAICARASLATIIDCVIEGNRAGIGGGICVENITGPARIIRCRITNNSSRDLGGGMYLGGFAEVHSCLIAGNRAWRGGGVDASTGGQVQVANCTIVGNRVASGGPGISAQHTLADYPSHIEVTNSILRNGGNEILLGTHATAEVLYSNMQGGWVGEGNADADPMFLAPGYWDDQGTPADLDDDVWIDGDYRIPETSPCVEAGNNDLVLATRDLAGRLRIVDGDNDGLPVVDLGAYEFATLGCGDGILDAGEACDDGNHIDDDGCEHDCTVSTHVCGNGILEWHESCDDGNSVNTDDCLDTCVLPTCGDGYAWAGHEPCDDGNTTNTDDCLNTCILPTCGDGFVWAGYEMCDDGNTIAQDGCENDCTISEHVCGNGILEWTEECDDGNTSNNDDCLNNCALPTCGDGYVWVGHEPCDDGNTTVFDGCSILCTPEQTWYVDGTNGHDEGTGSETDPVRQIQAGLHLAGPGDTILVADGLYVERNTLRPGLGGHTVRLQSAGGPQRCTIKVVGSWGRSRSAVWFDEWSPSQCILDGFTLTNAVGDQATGHAAVVCQGGSPTITNCIITGNDVGISCDHSAPTISNCAIIRNAKQSITCTNGSHPLIEQCTIAQNSPTLPAILCDQTSSSTFVGCIVWNQPAGFANPPEGASLNVQYSNIQGGWPGQGNIDTDPLLDASLRHLTPLSPCIDAGPLAAPLVALLDIDGEPRIGERRIDIGCDEFYDVDNDTLPDWWERLYFADATAGTPGEDLDQDGLTNLQEHARLRNPLEGPAVRYVSVDGDDTWDGLSPTQYGQHGPKATIQAAIDRANAFEGDQIIIQDGTYVLPHEQTPDLHGKRLTIRSANGPENCIIDCRDSTAGFSFRTDDDDGTIVDGLTITQVGGLAVYCPSGPAIAVQSASPTIQNCIITDNGSLGLILDTSDAIIINCEISHNRGMSTSGGGIHCKGVCQPQIRNCTINRNADHGGGPGSGGVACGEGASPLIDRCSFDEPYNIGLYYEADCHPFVSRCSFHRPHDSRHAFVYADGPVGNANAASRPTGTFINCLFVDERPCSGGLLAQFSLSAADTTLVNCTLMGSVTNTSDGMIYATDSHVTMSHTIVWSPWNTSEPLPITLDESSTLTATYSNIVGGWPGEGNIDLDPGFVNNGQWSDGGYPDDCYDDLLLGANHRLRPGSPCVNAGDPAFDDTDMPTDLDGQARIRCGRVDIGAYEYGLGNLDCNLLIDLRDFATWTGCMTAPQAGAWDHAAYDNTCQVLDFDSDGDVDLADFAGFQVSFGWAAEN